MPFTARSVLASSLLGLDPPELPVAQLVRLSSLFAISENRTRVALSRMVTSGEATTDGAGRYRLSGHLLDRQRRQRASRAGQTGLDTGEWHLVIVTTTGSTAETRALRRRAMTYPRLAELREGTWLRPANLPVSVGGHGDERCDPVHRSARAPRRARAGTLAPRPMGNARRGAPRGHGRASPAVPRTCPRASCCRPPSCAICRRTRCSRPPCCQGRGRVGSCDPPTTRGTAGTVRSWPTGAGHADVPRWSAHPADTYHPPTSTMKSVDPMVLTAWKPPSDVPRVVRSKLAIVWLAAKLRSETLGTVLVPVGHTVRNELAVGRVTVRLAARAATPAGMPAWPAASTVSGAPCWSVFPEYGVPVPALVSTRRMGAAAGTNRSPEPAMK